MATDAEITQVNNTARVLKGAPGVSGSSAKSQLNHLHICHKIKFHQGLIKIKAEDRQRLRLKTTSPKVGSITRTENAGNNLYIYTQ
jgi:hypothetical protein